MNRRQAIAAMGATALATLLPRQAQAAPRKLRAQWTVESHQQLVHDGKLLNRYDWGCLKLRPGASVLIAGQVPGEPDADYAHLMQVAHEHDWTMSIMRKTGLLSEQITRFALAREIARWVDEENRRRHPDFDVHAEILKPQTIFPDGWLFSMHHPAEGWNDGGPWNDLFPGWINVVTVPKLVLGMTAQADITIQVTPDKRPRIIAHRWEPCLVWEPREA